MTPLRRWRRSAEPDALVYRGPASLPGCPEAAARAVRAAGLSVDYIGPAERRRLDLPGLTGCQLYVQPGGGELEDAWPHVKPARHLLRTFVAQGGGYLGFCLGAYLAGKGPGFGLLPGDTDQYITSKGCDIRHDGDAIVTVYWRGQPRRLYFQDGPVLLFRSGADVEVLATYENRSNAAAVCRVGAGAVGLAGPHPEATPDWFSRLALAGSPPDGLDLAIDLIHRTMSAVGPAATS